jgi:hypothetical protein
MMTSLADVDSNGISPNSMTLAAFDPEAAVRDSLKRRLDFSDNNSNAAPFSSEIAEHENATFGPRGRMRAIVLEK